MSATLTTRKPQARDIGKARVLREGGWTYPDIARLLAEEDGVRVHWGTVRRWTDPREAERHRDYQRRWMAEYRRRERQGNPHTDPAELARRLRAEGQPLEGIARVCRVLFGGRWTRGMVERLLAEGES